MDTSKPTRFLPAFREFAARCVAPELLDVLPSHDPRALRSRNDLRQLNRIMGHAPRFARELRHVIDGRSVVRISELGAGDGSFMLDVARRMASSKTRIELSLIDRHNLVPERTATELAQLNWHVRPVTDDIIDWLDRVDEPVDVLAANLVLHHFTDVELRRLFRAATKRAHSLIALEPRRGILPAVFSRLLWGIGCGPITRHDAAISVRAGFAHRELSGLWPRDAGWVLRENRVGWFSHLFVANRKVPRSQ